MTLADRVLELTGAGSAVAGAGNLVNGPPSDGSAHQTMLVAAIETLPVADAEHACKAWRIHAEALLDGPEPNEPERSLSIARTPDGTLHGTLTVTNPHGTTTTSRPHGQLDWISTEAHDPVAA